MELLLLGNGKPPNPGLSAGPETGPRTLLARKQVKRILLIPYAVIRSDWDARAQDLTESGVETISIHQFDDPVDAINRADAIFIGGGSTWRLNQLLHEYGLVVPIQRTVCRRGVPYVGWSAGCNVAHPSIRTTNDMPVCSAAVLPTPGLFPRCKSTPLSGRQHQRPHGGAGRAPRRVSAPSTSEHVVALREGQPA